MKVSEGSAIASSTVLTVKVALVWPVGIVTVPKAEAGPL